MTMSIPNLFNCKVFKILLLCSIILSCFPGETLSAMVTLRSMKIFRTHEWFKSEPTIYFRCKNENKTELPDVIEKNITYKFNGEESWQPLTNFSSKKCKRCGFYEKGIIKLYMLDEWEFCPSDFGAPYGVYHRFKEKQFNATFRCPKCMPSKPTTHHHATASKPKEKKKSEKETHTHTAMVVTLSVVASTVVIIGFAALYKLWQKRRRQQEQARFLKLFEDMDDIDDELGLGPE